MTISTALIARKGLAVVAAAVVASTLALASPAEAQTLPSETRPQLFCSTDAAIAHPAAEVNKGGAPGWVYSIFYVHDSSTGRWTHSDWVVSYGGAGRQPSYRWTASGWVQIDHGGVTFKATPGSTQHLYELRYTQNQVIAHSNPGWSTEWVYGGSCSTNLQRPW
jgi:hypothetical protein